MVTATFPLSARWLFFAASGLALMMFSIDATIVAVALPGMTRDLRTSLAWVGWTLTAYALAQTVMMPLAGKLAESFGRMRVFLVGLFMSIFPVGGIIGPNLGGFIVEHWSWRECFYINLPLGAIVMVALLRRARQVEQTKRRRIDFGGTALFAVGIVSLLCAITFLGEDPSYWRTAQFWILLATSLAFLVGFVLFERRVS